MQTLIPQPASATAKPIGRMGRWWRFGFTPRGLLLFAVGFLLAAPAFWHPRAILLMVAWDAALLVLWLLDAIALPAPGAFTVTRAFLDSPQQGQPTRIELSVTMEANRVADLLLTDDLHPALIAKPQTQRVQIFPRDATAIASTVQPVERGDVELGRVYLRYRGAMKLAERWCAALPTDANGSPQRIRIYPALEENRSDAELFLLRARQIEMQKRRLRLRGHGRDFESLRDYQFGDELRNVSWTATARRDKLVARQFTVERSQQVWILIDAGRLSRTGFELKRGGQQFVGETEGEREGSHLLAVTQLDQAASAAAMLAQVVNGSGDKFALMTYGRAVQQLLTPGNGPAHLRVLIDQLSHTRSERAEADHLAAIARLKNLQRRRGLIVWVTELVDSVGRPEVVTAAAELVRRHLVVLVLLKHPELEYLAASTPSTREEMFHATAAQEMIERRREAIKQLERQGVLIVETTAEQIGVNTINKYLEVKAQGAL